MPHCFNAYCPAANAVGVISWVCPSLLACQCIDTVATMSLYNIIAVLAMLLASPMILYHVVTNDEI